MQASPSSTRPSSPAPSEHPSYRAVRPNQPSSFRFNWDASKPRGPGSVTSDANESRFDLSTSEFHPTLGITQYASSEVYGLNGHAFAPFWSSSTQGFNAISTVLNNPKKDSVALKHSRAPFPSTVSPDLPRVRRKDFDSYLTSISSEWERFRRRDARTENSYAPALTKGKTREVPFLTTVPAVFFDPEFDLGNPRTFYAVTEQDSASGSTVNPEDISVNQILQEKLSRYLDIVEQHLTNEIQSRSTSFFAALSNLQDLQTEGADCLERIENLRNQLREIDDRIARKGLSLTGIQKQESNMKVIEMAVDSMKEVREMILMCDKLVDEGNWDEAIGLISVLEDFRAQAVVGYIPSPNLNGVSLTGGPSSPIHKGHHFSLGQASIDGFPSSSSHQLTPTSEPFFGRLTAESQAPEVSHQNRSQEESTCNSASNSYAPFGPSFVLSLASFSTLPSRLGDFNARITESLLRSLLDLLRDDISSRFALPSHGTDASSRYFSLTQRFIPLWQGLLRTGGVSQALTQYREMTLSEIRVCVRKGLPQKADVEDDDDLVDRSPGRSMGERSAALSRDLKSLSHNDFMSLSRNLYSGLLRCFDGIAEHVKLFGAEYKHETRIPDKYITTNKEALSSGLIDAVMPAATELANIRVSKVILVRSEQHGVLSMPEFLELFNESWRFVVKCEVLARKMIVGLRGVMVSQAKAFLINLHAARISSSASLVENEVWAQAEVSEVSQHHANLLVDAAVTNPAELVLSHEPLPRATPASDHARGPLKQLMIEGRTYYVVSATLKVIEMLLDYVRVVINLTLLTTDTMSRTIEYLKAFNSRTCQVVLGAGAMRSAGLRNITAKHLALASQSLSIMTALIPYVREAFRRHLNSQQAVMLIEFDKLKRDYYDHQNEIHSKLIAIMGDRLNAHCKSLQVIDWGSTEPWPNPNPYMEMLMRETLTLHKVLSKYLVEQTVEMIMGQVFAAINHRLSEEYSNIELPSQDAKERMLQDARYLHEKLSALKDIGVPSGMLETVVKEKIVARRSPFARKFANRVSLAMNNSAVATDSPKPQNELPLPTDASAESVASGFQEFKDTMDGDSEHTLAPAPDGLNADGTPENNGASVGGSEEQNQADRKASNSTI
ncbi:Vps54-like protein-domain-containing protein [Cantharellus anzutake]|uniref:Vps54-like protein-domain-containing protein n=1 Tax=Cantharellus anzutake TaxID=1750568 RepID=UPI0019042EEB|nr:Vps54-like protein-domain-containing protein [Cantharellus anzutake]KAF8334202.1 Vps54-like protein-domain-containing protein [Cantharellus anzutake]